MTASQTPAATNVELSRVNLRFGITGLMLGDESTFVAKQAASIYHAAPRCEDRRVAIANTRKAFGLRICEYKPAAVSLLGSSVVRVVTYLLDDTMVRLDIDTNGDQLRFDAASSKLEMDWRSGTPRMLNASNRSELVWRSGTDEMAMSLLESQGVIEYRIRDMRLSDKLPWLAE